VNEFLKYFDLQKDERISGNYLTVAGLFNHLFHGLPNVGDKVHLSDLELEVVDKDGHRLDKILVKRIA